MRGVKKSRPSAGTKGRKSTPGAAKPAGRGATKRVSRPAKAATPARRGTGKSRKAEPPKKQVAKPTARSKKTTASKKAVAKKAVAKKAVAKKIAPKKVVTKTAAAKKANGRKPRREVERSIVRIRDLDPYRKCGPGTSVERLIRVDEMVDRELQAHLVFFDRHGWYCEHGQGCHAVGHARKHASHVERPGW